MRVKVVRGGGMVEGRGCKEGVEGGEGGKLL